MDIIVLPISAGISGIIESIATHPIDRIKTKIQEISLETKTKCNITSAINIIYKQNKISGFYSGLVPKIIGMVPMRTIYWTSMTKMNQIVENKHQIVKYIFPGLVAGSIQTIVDTPIEVMKIQLMTKKIHEKSNNKINLNTIKNLYSGFYPNLMRNCIFAISVASTIKLFGNKKENTFIAGATGGLIGSIISQPFDVAKTELQRCKNNNQSRPNKQTFQIMKNIATTNFSQLWAGGSMRCCLAFFNMGIGYYSLEFIKTKIEKICN